MKEGISELCTTLICNRIGKIILIFKDELLIFNKNDQSLYDILDKDSYVNASNFFDSFSKRPSILNWGMNVIINEQLATMQFSGLLWEDNLLIKISKKNIGSFFPDISDVNQIDSNNELALNSKNKKIQIPEVYFLPEELDDFTRINNELVATQRELIKKNIESAFLNEKLEKLATIDSLTEIYNRRTIVNYAKSELVRAKRERKKFGLAMLDLDHFKIINDTYGHQTGDTALKLFANCIKKSLREYDKVGRFGGDEFFLYLSIDPQNDTKIIVQRIFENIKKLELPIPDGDKIHFQASIGAVDYHANSDDGVEIDILMHQADEAMYHVKRSGGNGIHIVEFKA